MNWSETQDFSPTKTCLNIRMLIKSADFLKWVDIILDLIENNEWCWMSFDKNEIKKLFSKMQLLWKDGSENFTEEEIADLENFLSNDNVIKKILEFLAKLENITENDTIKKISILQGKNNIETLKAFEKWLKLMKKISNKEKWFDFLYNAIRSEVKREVFFRVMNCQYDNKRTILSRIFHEKTDICWYANISLEN